MRLPERGRPWQQGFSRQASPLESTAPLSLEQTPFRIRILESVLYAWSAVSCLVIPSLLMEKVGVDTRCPATGGEIKLFIAPEGIQSADPAGCVLSIAPPNYSAARAPVGEPSSAIGANRVMRFFSSRQAASMWLIPYPDVKILNLDEAWRLVEAAFKVDYEY